MTYHLVPIGISPFSRHRNPGFLPLAGAFGAGYLAASPTGRALLGAGAGTGRAAAKAVETYGKRFDVPASNPQRWPTCDACGHPAAKHDGYGCQGKVSRPTGPYGRAARATGPCPCGGYWTYGCGPRPTRSGYCDPRDAPGYTPEANPPRVHVVTGPNGTYRVVPGGGWWHVIEGQTHREGTRHLVVVHDFHRAMAHAKHFAGIKEFKDNPLLPVQPYDAAAWSANPLKRGASPWPRKRGVLVEAAPGAAYHTGVQFADGSHAALTASDDSFVRRVDLYPGDTVVAAGHPEDQYVEIDRVQTLKLHGRCPQCWWRPCRCHEGNPSRGRARNPAACEGCGAPLGPVEAARWGVCMDCTRARHQAVLKGRCSCGRKRRERDVSNGIRSWVSCDRCLGFVRPLPDPPRGRRNPATKKDFVSAAALLRARGAGAGCVGTFEEYFAGQSPRFDRERFRHAAGVTNPPRGRQRPPGKKHRACTHGCFCVVQRGWFTPCWACIACEQAQRAGKKPRARNPRAYDQGAFVRVTLTENEVSDFKSRWPASGLPSRGVSFTFDKQNGDLVDLSPDSLDGAAAVALSEDAWNYWARKHDRPTRNPTQIQQQGRRPHGPLFYGPQSNPRAKYDQHPFLQHLLGNIHVGTPDAEVVAIIGAKLNKNLPKRTRDAVLRAAIRIHHANLKLYREVMRFNGHVPDARRGGGRRTPRFPTGNPLTRGETQAVIRSAEAWVDEIKRRRVPDHLRAFTAGQAAGEAGVAGVYGFKDLQRQAGLAAGAAYALRAGNPGTTRAAVAVLRAYPQYGFRKVAAWTEALQYGEPCDAPPPVCARIRATLAKNPAKGVARVGVQSVPASPEEILAHAEYWLRADPRTHTYVHYQRALRGAGLSARAARARAKLVRSEASGVYTPARRPNAALTPAKAGKILHDKTVRGRSITERQRRYFGAVASGLAAKNPLASHKPGCRCIYHSGAMFKGRRARGGAR